MEAGWPAVVGGALCLLAVAGLAVRAGVSAVVDRREKTATDKALGAINALERAYLRDYRPAAGPVMSPELVSVLAQILAQQALVLGMQADNAARAANGVGPCYFGADFGAQASELQRLGDSARMLQS